MEYSKGETCQGCLFFRKEGISVANFGGGERAPLSTCNSRPPRVVVMPNGSFHTVWPVVKETDWCGEWQPDDV